MARKKRIRSTRSATISSERIPPLRGFEYFDSPESDADEDIIAHIFIRCLVAVQKWPAFRQRAIRATVLSPEQCDYLERNTIEPFRETRDAIEKAIDTADFTKLVPMGEKYLFASAHIAMYAAPETLVEYQKMIFGEIERFPANDVFLESLWEIDGNQSDESFRDTILRNVKHNEFVRKNNGSLTSDERSDRVVADAGAHNLERLEPIVDPLYPTEPLHKPVGMKHRQSSPFSERDLTKFRQRLRALKTRLGLTKRETDLLVKLALDGAKPGDDPSACRAIRERKRQTLLPEIEAILESLR